MSSKRVHRDSPTSEREPTRVSVSDTSPPSPPKSAGISDSERESFSALTKGAARRKLHRAPVPPEHRRAPRIGWRIYGSRYLVYDKFMNIRQDDVSIGQRRFRYSYLDHPGAVFAVALTKEQEFVLIRLFRYPLDEWCWEVPSGSLGDKAGKSPLQVAKDELREEAGGVSKKWTSLGWFWSANGVARLKIHYFLAEDVKLLEASPEESEQISKIQRVSLKELEHWFAKAKIKDGDSVFALLLAMRHLSQRKTR